MDNMYYKVQKNRCLEDEGCSEEKRNQGCDDCSGMVVMRQRKA